MSLNPPFSYIIEPGDDLVVLAEDDMSYSVAPFAAGLPPRKDSAATSSAFLPPAPPAPRRPERLLIVGWRHDSAWLFIFYPHISKTTVRKMLTS